MKLNLLNLWTGGATVVLVGSQTIAMAAAGAWAVAGLLHLAPAFAATLMALAVLAGLAVSAFFAGQVHRVEPFFERAGATRVQTASHVDAAGEGQPAGELP